MIAQHRKAIAAAVTALVGALTVGVLQDGIDGVEAVGIVGAVVLAFVGVWASPANEPPPAGDHAA